MTYSVSLTVAVEPLKQRALRSFHTCQETSANRESRPGRRSLLAEERSRRHQLNVVGAACGN